MTDTNFIAYEYLEQRIPKTMQNAYLDGYANFGWTVTDRTPDIGKNTVTLKLKRDRNLSEKAALNRLQKQFEQELASAAAMESSKTSVPTMIALGIGLLGTVFMAGSVFAYIGGLLLLSIILAVPGFIGWGLAYFSFNWAQSRRTQKLAPALTQTYDAAAEDCKQAFQLMH